MTQRDLGSTSWSAGAVGWLRARFSAIWKRRWRNGVGDGVSTTLCVIMCLIVLLQAIAWFDFVILVWIRRGIENTVATNKAECHQHCVHLSQCMH